MRTLPPLWGILGLFAGGWKLVIVAIALFSLFGRGLRPYLIKTMANRLGVGPLVNAHQAANPAAAPAPAPPARRSWISDRVFIFLLVLAATAMASVILGRLWIMQGSAPEAPAPSPSPDSQPLPARRTGHSVPPPVSFRLEELADDDSRVSAQL